MRVAHFAFYLGFWNECCNGVNDYDVDGTASYEGICDLECLFAVIRLRDQEIVGIDTEFFCVCGIKCVFCVDESCNTAHFLCLCDNMESDCRFTGRFGTIDLDDSSARYTAYSECDIKRECSCRNHFYVHFSGDFAQFHDRTFAEIFFDLANRII